MRGLLDIFWKNQEVVTRQNIYHGPYFRATRSTTQGEVALQTLLNVAVNSVVCHWISLMVEDKAVIQDGLVKTLGQSLGVSMQIMGFLDHGNWCGYM